MLRKLLDHPSLFNLLNFSISYTLFESGKRSWIWIEWIFHTNESIRSVPMTFLFSNGVFRASDVRIGFRIHGRQLKPIWNLGAYNSHIETFWKYQFIKLFSKFIVISWINPSSTMEAQSAGPDYNPRHVLPLTSKLNHKILYFQDTFI